MGVQVARHVASPFSSLLSESGDVGGEGLPQGIGVCHPGEDEIVLLGKVQDRGPRSRDGA